MRGRRELVMGCDWMCDVLLCGVAWCCGVCWFNVCLDIPAYPALLSRTVIAIHVHYVGSGKTPHRDRTDRIFDSDPASHQTWSNNMHMHKQDTGRTSTSASHLKCSRHASLYSHICILSSFQLRIVPNLVCSAWRWSDAIVWWTGSEQNHATCHLHK